MSQVIVPKVCPFTSAKLNPFAKSSGRNIMATLKTASQTEYTPMNARGP